MLSTKIIIEIIVFTIFVWLLSSKLLRKLFKVENYGVYKKREKQLKFEKKEKFNSQTEELIHKSTSPILKVFGSYIGDRNKEKITKELVFVGWDKYLDFRTYKALQIFFTMIGLVLFMILFSEALAFAIFCFVVFAFSMPYLLKNEVKDKRKKLIAEFPDFIRITQGYLSSGLTFVYAVEASLRFLGDDWREFLTELVVDIKLTNTRDALERFRERVDLREVREFVAIVVLSLDQGGDVKTAFESQADSIQFMLTDLMEKELVKRNAFGQALQPALLISIILGFAGPMIIEMMGIGNMGL